ncbi:uncharacterized protein LOC110269156 [Arachis ipaensis]|uniref:uncharacterized protein LOC110269156 n=1 Tax=Arachis ipaensis TaxID=130454 RepID=UPI000A2B6B9F|nr:uncharacterized protein LOC110269156 [Arachis ipaensis]
MDELPQNNVGNYSGKRRGRKPNGLGKHAVKDSNGDGNAYVVEVSKAQNNDGKYSGKRRGGKPKELRNDAVKDSNGSCNGRASEAKENDGETPQKNDHIHPPSGIEIKVKEEIEEDDDDALCKRRQKVPSLNLEHYWHDDKANATKYTKYREKLMQELEKPYCEEEYKKLFKYMKHRKLVEYHKEHRSGPRTCKRNYLGKSLLNHHVGLNKKLKSVSGDYPKRLTLLRGFVFWLTVCENVGPIVQNYNSYFLDRLSEDYCWSIFADNSSFPESNGSTELEGIGRMIVKKCDGLPLAAETLGRLLRSKHDVKEWNKILSSDIWEFSVTDSKVVPALLISYYHLPAHLKRCFIYSSLYPKDYQFDKNELIMLWMSEDLLRQPKGGETLEEVGCECFDDLASRLFFKQVDDDDDKYFVMHDLVHDLAFLAENFIVDYQKNLVKRKR